MKDHKKTKAQLCEELAELRRQLTDLKHPEEPLRSAEAQEERRPTEEALRKSEYSAYSAINALSSHLAILDETGTIVAVNQSWRNFAAANPPVKGNVFEGANYLSVCDAAEGPDSEEAKVVAAAIRALIRGDENPFALEYPCHSPDKKRWFIVHLTRFAASDGIRIVAAHENITERKLAEEAHRASEESFRQIFEQISCGVGIYEAVEDGRDFIIKEINAAAASSLQLPREAVLKNRITHLLPSIGDYGLLAVFERVWRTGVAERIPPKLYHDDRLKLWMENYVARLSSGAIVGIFQDITEQVRNREHLDLLRMELMHAGRLTALGELASGIAHEINQPLSVISAWAEVARREIAEHLQGNKQESLLSLERVRGAVERAGNIVSRMRTLARKSEMQLSSLSLHETVSDVYPLVEHELRFAGVEMVIDLDPALPAVSADRVQIQQVFLNLIRNALDAMKDTASGDRRLEIRGRFGNSMLEVSVQDTGCGIPPEESERVFEPFRTTKPNGMGLGLSICRTIIESHGGRIWVASEPNSGATIVFTLPRAEK